MIDLFGIRRRREEREREAAEERARMMKNRERVREDRKNKIDSFLKKYYSELEIEGKKLMEEDKKRCEEENSNCPKCGGTTIINKFVRIQGKVSGNSHGSFLSSYGTVDGELDTFKVNECKSCGHQWEISKPEYNNYEGYVNDLYSIWDYGSYIGFLYRRIEKLLGKEENLEKIKLLENSYKDTPREILEYCLYNWDKKDNSYIRISNSILGTKLIEDENKSDYNDDQYLFKLSDEVWRMIEILTGRREP